MDIQGGALTQPNGSPALPGTSFDGPLIAGNILHGDGTTNLAGVGGTSGGQANSGYVVMAQMDVITQAASAGQAAGVFLSSAIIIPAQSQILSITLMVTTAWSGASATLGIGNTVSATAYTAAGAGNANVRGLITFSPGTTAAAIALWDNVGTTDVQIKITSTNTGNGVGTLTVTYVQSNNLAS